jgi:probable F420-dependent oxidoreductase
MKFGYKLPNCAGVLCEPDWATPDNLMRLGRLAATLGFSSLWFHDHLLAPLEVNIAAPNFYEPLISIAHLANVLPGMTFGVATLVVPLRDPVLLARQLTTLNAFHPGRVILGVGVGRYKSEFEASGSDAFHRRGRMATEALELIRALWRDDDVDFAGEFYKTSGARHFPKVTAANRMPIWVGGNAPAAIKRAAKLGDGFLPAARTAAELRADCDLLRRELEHLGRDSEAFPIGLSLTVDLRQAGEHEAEDLEERGMHGHASSRIVSGGPAQVLDKMRELASVGIGHFALSFRAASLQQLEDRMTLFASDVQPHLAEGG